MFLQVASADLSGVAKAIDSGFIPVSLFQILQTCDGIFI